MSPGIILAVFPLVFLAELPDKTMFASLLLASRGRPLSVWIGAAAAFAVHVVIAVSVGVVVFNLLPRRAVDAVVAALFLGGAAWALLSNPDEHVEKETQDRSALATAVTAGTVIFVAEWGDLTQILTANLAAHYRNWLSVGIGSLAALMAVAGVAVLSGSRLLAKVPVRPLRIATAVVLVGLAAWAAVEAAS